MPAKSDIKKKYFGTDGIRGCVGTRPIDAEFILKLGWASGKVLGKKGGSKVLIGKDTRISGYMFESALEAGLSAAGVDTLLLGPMPTPAISYLTRTLRVAAGIVISASHNPYFDNGIKFFSPQGTKLPDEIELEIEDQLEKKFTTVESAKLGKASRIVDAPGRYIEFCKSTVPNKFNLNGMKIIVDCANGATYQVAPCVFRELGAEIIEIGVKPDGLNINLDCGATHTELLQKTVLEQKADLGIALDGDGDRVIMVDHKGIVVDGDEILFAIAKNHHDVGLLNGGVVGTVMTNIGFEKSLEDLQIPFVRTKVGDRYVIEELRKRNWILGGEQSGHIICSESVTTGDGIISALQLLCAMQSTGKSLFDIKQGFVKFPQVLINVKVADSFDLHDKPKIAAVKQKVEAELGSCGRVLLRRSGTESLVRVMLEGEDQDIITSLANEIANVVKSS